MMTSIHGSPTYPDGTSRAIPAANHTREPLTAALIASVSDGVPAALTELRRLGRTLKLRSGDVLASFDRPDSINGPTEAIIIWSPQWRVLDVAREADRVRQSPLSGACLRRRTCESPCHCSLFPCLPPRGASVIDMYPTQTCRSGDVSRLGLQITINGRLEHLRGSALGFRNLTNYVARSLLEAGGFRSQLHLGL